MRLVLVPVVAIVLSACGGGSSPGAPPPAAVPQVAGAYDVAVRLLQNDCAAPPVVMPQPTSVAQTPGASDFTLTHGGLRATGSVARDGAVTTQPLTGPDGVGSARPTIAGRV